MNFKIKGLHHWTFLLGAKVHEEPETSNRKNKTIKQNHKTKSKTYIPHIVFED